MKALILLTIAAISIALGKDKGDEYACIRTFLSASEDTTPVKDGYEDLYNHSKYEEIVKKAQREIAIGNKVADGIGWLAEAYYGLAEVKSGNEDPRVRSTRVYIDDAGASDPIGYQIRQIEANIGPNPWTDEAIKKYGEPGICIIKDKIKEKPKFTGYQSRLLATYLAMKRYDEFEKHIQSLEDNTLDYPNGKIPYLISFTERFIGYKEYTRAIEYFIKVSDKEFRKDNKHWVSVFKRLKKDDKIPESMKVEYSKYLKQIEK